MASRAEFAASIKAKYPQYANVDDSTLVDKMLEKYPQYRDKVTEDAAPAPADAPVANPGNTKPEITNGLEAAFPRTSKAQSLGGKLGGATLDVLSLPGRTIAASTDHPIAPFAYAGADYSPKDGEEGSFTPQGGRQFANSLGDTKGGSIPGRIVRDPGLAASLLAAPLTGGVSLAGLGGLAARSALTGAASVAAHQGDNILDGKGFQPKQALAEEALNVAIPVLGAKIAGPLKSAGVKIYNSVLKPSGRTIKAGFAPSKAEVLKGTEALLESGHTSKGGLAAANQSVEDRIDELAGQIEDIITQKSRPQTVTTKAEAFDQPVEKTGIDATGGTEEPPIYAQPPRAGQLPGGSRQLPESTVPGPPGVVNAGMNKPPQIGGPEPIITPAPRPGATPPDVAITPNRTPMPNQIDPRFVRPTATRTPNQPPIPDAPEGVSYGALSDRNLPAPYQPAGPLVGQPAPAAGAPSEEEIRQALLGRSAGLPGQPLPEASTIPPGGIRQPGQLPPGATGPAGKTIDVTKRIDLMDALNAAKRGIGQELTAGDHAGLASDVGKGVSQWRGDLVARGMAGPVSPKQALTYQRGVGAMGKFDYGQNPQLVPPKARVANKLYGQIGDRLEEVAPEIGPLRKEISTLIPQRMALTDAAARTDKNFAVGLREALAGAAALSGAASGGPAAALPALGLAGTIRAASSPRAGDALFRAGKSLGQQSTLRDAIKRMLLETVFAPGDSLSP